MIRLATLLILFFQTASAQDSLQKKWKLFAKGSFVIPAGSFSEYQHSSTLDNYDYSAGAAQNGFGWIAGAEFSVSKLSALTVSIFQNSNKGKTNFHSEPDPAFQQYEFSTTESNWLSKGILAGYSLSSNGIKNRMFFKICFGWMQLKSPHYHNQYSYVYEGTSVTSYTTVESDQPSFKNGSPAGLAELGFSKRIWNSLSAEVSVTYLYSEFKFNGEYTEVTRNRSVYDNQFVSSFKREKVRPVSFKKNTTLLGISAGIAYAIK